jgi:drug/metabolite transporter (DMT)-like permease
MALGILVLGETLSAARVAGTLLVATGIFLVARS